MLRKIFLFVAALALSSVAFAEAANQSPAPASASMSASANVMAVKNVDHLEKMTNEIRVRAADVEMTKRGQTSTEVKMEIMNHNKQAMTLIAATSPAARVVQLHDFANQDGHQMMQQIHQVEIPAQADENLSFTGVHVMLIDLVKPLHAGEMVPITLAFSDGSQVMVKAKVVKAMKPHQMKHKK